MVENVEKEIVALFIQGRGMLDTIKKHCKQKMGIKM